MDELTPQPEQPAKKARKPRAPKAEKPKKAKPVRDIRTVFREKLAGITVDGIKKPWMAEKVFRLVTTADELEAWVNGILADASRHHSWAGVTCPVIAVDTETTSLDTRIFTDIKQTESGEWVLVYEVKTEIAGVCLSADGIEGLYIPVNHEKGQNVPRADVARILQRLFDKSHLIFYNAKFDREVMKITLGINFRGYPHFEDVQVLNYINDPKADFGDKASFQGGAGGLKKLSEGVLNIEQIEIDEVAKVRCHVWNAETQKNTLKQKVVPFTWIPPDVALWYAAADAICTWLLWDRMKELARSRRLVHRIDHELVDSLAYVERQRFLVDVDRQRRTARWHARTLVALKEKLAKLAEAAGWTQEFNPGSPKQLGELLFKVMGFKPFRNTDSGAASTDKETLTELAKDNPDNEFLNALKDFRELAALHPDNLRYDPKDNSARIYLKQNVVAGGRLSGGGGEFEKDGGLEWNPQGVKKLEKDDFWRVYGNVLEPDSVPDYEIEEHDESELHPSCFIEDKGVRQKAPGIIKNHIGIYQDYAICLVPGCTTCKDKFGILIEDTSLDANQVVNLRVLMKSLPGWTFFSIDYCFLPHTKVLTSSLLWKPVKDVVKGEELIGFDENLPEKRGVGKGNGKRRKMRPSRVLDIKALSLPCVRITTNKGVIECSEEHAWLVNRSAGGRRQVRGTYGWKSSKDLKPGDKIPRFCDTWETETSYGSGYLAGLLDGEGWVGPSGVGFGQNPGVVLEEYKNLLAKYGYQTAYDKCNRSNVKSVRVLGGRKESLRLLGSVRPKRLLQKASRLWDGAAVQSRYFVPDEVISVEDIGVQEVVAVKTTTRTLIAEGLLSHNCNIEMRAMANLSGEPKYVQEFLTGSGDFHDLTAKNIFPQYSDPTSKDYKSKTLRGVAKIINFAINYGGTAHAIYKNLIKKDKTMTMKKAEELVAKYWAGVPEFRKWCDVKQARARNEFVTETATGRVLNFKSAMEHEHIHVPTDKEKSLLKKYYDYKRESKVALEQKNEDAALSYKNAADRLWKNPDTGVRNAIEYNQFIGKMQRVAVNTPVQGLCGDFMRISINRIKKWIEKDPDVQRVFRFHGSVHDEIDVSIKNEYVPFILPRLTRWMKLRKYHESMGWPVPIECDAEYGRSWDVDWSINKVGYTYIDGLETYVPDMFNSTTVNNLYKAIASGDEQKHEKAKGYLQKSLHRRAFESAGRLFKTQDRKEIQNQLVAVLQLHEYWTIDHTPDGDENDKALETLAQYEERVGINFRDPLCPEFGYMGPIPFDANVIRPEPNLLGDEPGGEVPPQETPVESVEPQSLNSDSAFLGDEGDQTELAQLPASKVGA